MNSLPKLFENFVTSGSWASSDTTKTSCKKDEDGAIEVDRNKDSRVNYLKATGASQVVPAKETGLL